jgi:import inner membrane translocase subunit TIM54
MLLQSPAAANVDAKKAKPTKPPNPVFRMMGLPNIKMKLPSRNWMIFLSITGSFTAAVIYDKRETKRVQRKWSKLVEHTAKEPLGDPTMMPRKLTVFLEGPPSDGLRIAQDHFKEYVKPILVSSGLDWEFVQGRKEGDIRAELAEKIRKSRTPGAEEEDNLLRTRRGMGIKDFDGIQGDIVIGRNTWKEYVRGLHEGWLGPLEAPPLPEPELPPPALKEETPIETLPGITVHSSPGQDEVKAEEPASEAPKKPSQLPPYISTADYESASLPSDIPSELPSAPIAFPHILGFLNTPTRLYRFLNGRHLADQIGRDTAAIVLASFRPYHTTSNASGDLPINDNGDHMAHEVPEQVSLLKEEEKEWHKSTHVRKEGEEDKERVWIDPIVLDPRIANRMTRAELSAEDEERAKSIVVTEEEIEGKIKGGLRHLYNSSRLYFWPEKKFDPRDLTEDE